MISVASANSLELFLSAGNRFVSIDKRDVRTECRGCAFYDDRELRKRVPILVPTPPRTNIVVISRDPTIDFIGIYDYAQHLDEDKRRIALFSSGIPQQLLVQIGRFLREGRGDGLEKKTRTCYRLFQVAYWTHLHKCPTDNGNKFGRECANRYLQAEIENALQEGAATLVTLGRDVKAWVSEHKSVLTKDVEVISLPHPSAQNNSIWCRSNKVERERIIEVEDKIWQLMKSLAII
jgi:hypothetical protein